MVLEALNKNMPLVRIIVDEAHWQEYQYVYKQYSNLEWLLVDSRVFKYIADTQNPQGIIALARIPQPEFSQLLNQKACVFLLDRVSDPGNMGTIIRTAWALDIEGILLTEDCTDPFSPKVVRASMGGILNVPVYTAVSWESIKQLRAKGYQIVGTAIDAPVNFFDFNYSGANIIVIGSESKGVSNDILVNCDSLIKIPINPVVDSLNAAIACAIIMMEIRKQRKR